jgi:hypothetical protein
MLSKTGRTALLVMVIEALLSCRSSESDVVISEFLASNTKGLTDIDGETSDWIELQNRGSVSVNLDGWCLTDDSSQPCRWRFPAVSIAAGGHLLVFASGKNFTSASEQLHSNFKLKATKDYLGLLRPSGSVVHEFAPYPEQKSDVSFGLTHTGEQVYLRHPTPGAPNSEALP